MFLLGILLVWLSSSILLWAYAKAFDGWAKAALRGSSVGVLIAPAFVSGGYSVVPAPAIIGFMLSFSKGNTINWSQLWISLGSLVLVSGIAFVVVLIFTDDRPDKK